MLCTVYKDLQNFITILEQTSLLFHKTTPQQPNTTQSILVQTGIWRTKSLRSMSIIKIAYTSKSINWFSKLCYA